MSTTPKMVPISVYAVQTHDHTHIMAQVPGDKPVCLLAYSRPVVAEATTFSAMAVGGEPLEGDVVIVSVDLSKPKPLEVKPEKDDGGQRRAGKTKGKP